MTAWLRPLLHIILLLLHIVDSAVTMIKYLGKCHDSNLLNETILTITCFSTVNCSQTHCILNVVAISATFSLILNSAVLKLCNLFTKGSWVLTVAEQESRHLYILPINLICRATVYVCLSVIKQSLRWIILARVWPKTKLFPCSPYISRVCHFLSTTTE